MDKDYESKGQSFVMKSRAHVIFRGRVQGVFFRANTAEKARDCGVFGYVRNLRDGSVEAIFEGEEELVKELLNWCKTSQPFAMVDATEVTWGKSIDEFTDFEIRH